MKKSGFTLAEVLITLSIIGVVSALTIPNLGASTSASKNRATLKNTIATLNSALTQNEAQFGWNLGDVSEPCSYGKYSAALEKAKDKYSKCALFNSQLIGETYLGNTLTYVASAANEYGFKGSGHSYMQAAIGSSYFYGSMVAYRLANGAVFGIAGADGASGCMNDNYYDLSCLGFIDVNGNAGPNEPLKCEAGYINSYVSNGPAAGGSLCKVKENTNADIFPIYFHANSVVPGTNAVIQYLSE